MTASSLATAPPARTAATRSRVYHSSPLRRSRPCPPMRARRRRWARLSPRPTAAHATGTRTGRCCRPVAPPAPPRPLPRTGAHLVELRGGGFPADGDDAQGLSPDRNRSSVHSDRERQRAEDHRGGEPPQHFPHPDSGPGRGLHRNRSKESSGRDSLPRSLAFPARPTRPPRRPRARRHRRSRPRSRCTRARPHGCPPGPCART
jgi:hypothetical protein